MRKTYDHQLTIIAEHYNFSREAAASKRRYYRGKGIDIMKVISGEVVLRDKNDRSVTNKFIGRPKNDGSSKYKLENGKWCYASDAEVARYVNSPLFT